MRIAAKIDVCLNGQGIDGYFTHVGTFEVFPQHYVVCCVVPDRPISQTRTHLYNQCDLGAAGQMIVWFDRKFENAARLTGAAVLLRTYL